MPTYEYKCNNCGHAFEKFHSIMAAPIKKCPECGKNAVERLISAGGGIIFKGSGFYITDYRDSAYNDKAKAESGTTESSPEGGAKPADGATPAAASTESKPATSGETKKAESKPDAKDSPKTENKPAKSETKSEGKPAKKSNKSKE